MLHKDIFLRYSSIISSASSPGLWFFSSLPPPPRCHGQRKSTEMQRRGQWGECGILKRKEKPRTKHERFDTWCASCLPTVSRFPHELERHHVLPGSEESLFSISASYTEQMSLFKLASETSHVAETASSRLLQWSRSVPQTGKKNIRTAREKDRIKTRQPSANIALYLFWEVV